MTRLHRSNAHIAAYPEWITHPLGRTLVATVDLWCHFIAKGTKVMQIECHASYSRLWLSTIAPGPRLTGTAPLKPGLLFSSGLPAGSFVK